MNENKEDRKPIIVPMHVPTLPEGTSGVRAYPGTDAAGNPACIICGGTQFAHGPSGRKSQTGAWPRCEGCKSLERHRILRKLWVKIPENVLSQSNLLQFSPDLSISNMWLSWYFPE